MRIENAAKVTTKEDFNCCSGLQGQLVSNFKILTAKSCYFSGASSGSVEFECLFYFPNSHFWDGSNLNLARIHLPQRFWKIILKSWDKENPLKQKASWKLFLSSAAAAWLRSQRERHGTLARIAGASFRPLNGRRRWTLVGEAGTILPCCWRRSGGAGVALLNLSPLPTRHLPDWSERSPDAHSKPTMSP